MAENGEDSTEHYNSDDEVPVYKACEEMNDQTADDMYCEDIDFRFTKTRKRRGVQNDKSKAHFVFDNEGLYKCDEHNDLLRFFCKDENQLCCGTCAFLFHRNCHIVEEIQKLAVRTSSARSELQKKFGDIELKAKENKSNILSAKESLDNFFQMLDVKRKRERVETIEIFDDSERYVNENTILLHELTEKQTLHENYVYDATKYLKTIEKVRQIGTPLQQFIFENRMKKAADELQMKVDEERRYIKNVSEKYDIAKIQKVLRSEDKDCRLL